MRAVLILLLLASCLRADEIQMKNGDRVTGSIVKKDGKTLTIQSIHFGLVTLPWEEVASVKTSEPLTVVLPGDKTVNATLSTQQGQIEVAAPGATVETVPPASILVLRNAVEEATYERMRHPSWLRLWVIAGNLSLAGTSGNSTNRTFAIPVTAVRATNNDKTNLYFNFISASSTLNKVDSLTARAARGGLSYNRNISKRMFVNVFNDYEYDRFQDLDLRVVAGGGLGVTLWKKAEIARLDATVGGAWNHESYGPQPPAKPLTRSSAEAFWGNDFSYKFSQRLGLTERYRMFNNLTTTGVYRQNFDTAITATVMKWLTWNASLSDRFVSNPVGALKKNDFLYSTGFGVLLTH